MNKAYGNRRRILDSKLKYLFLVPIVIMITSCMYFNAVIGEVYNTILTEKGIEKSHHLNVVGSIIDLFLEMDQDWVDRDYSRVIAACIQNVSKADTSFAAAYDHDLNVISSKWTQSDDMKQFDPTRYPEFVAAIENSEEGHMELSHHPLDSGKATKSLVFYKWLPGDSQIKDRVLIVTAITTGNITTEMNAWITYGVIALIVLTTAINMVMVAIIFRNETSKLSELTLLSGGI